MNKPANLDVSESAARQPHAVDRDGMSDDDPQAAVVVDQTRAVLNTIPVGFGGGVVPAGVIAWLLHPGGAAPALWAWFIWMVVAHLGRVGLWVAARRDPSFSMNAARWLRRLRVGVLLLGLSWAALPLLFAPVTRFDELLVAAVIVAVCGAGVAQQSSDAPSAVLFMLPPALGVTAMLFSSSDPTLSAVGILAVLYFAFLGLAARRIHGSFRELSLLHARARRQSLHDSLTGLPNRVAFDMRLHDAIARARRNGTEVAVGYIDLDGFKDVNDTHGHDAGDRLLREVARRWRAALRDTELIARLGGDEFAILIEDLQPVDGQENLGVLFARLHETTAEPVLVSGQQSARIAMTMGVALYPQDGAEPDLLLRQADAAMYQLKLQKATRTSWWQLGVRREATPEPQTLMIDPYGEEANRLLTEAAELFERANTDFAEAFYEGLATDPAARALMSALTDAEYANLKRRQKDYLAMLLDPGATRDTLVNRARHVGVMHCLSGVSGSMLARSSVNYRALLDQRLDMARLPSGRRYRLFSLVEARLEDALQAQFIAAESVTQAYLEAFSRQRPHGTALWSTASQEEMDFVARLPGMVAAVLFRVGGDGLLVVERSASLTLPNVSTALFGAEGFPSLDRSDPRNNSATAAAWHSQTIERIDSWSKESRAELWRAEGQRLGIRSSASIPLQDQDGHMVGVLSIYGSQPNQFSAPWMQQWTSGLQRRMEAVWSQCSMASNVMVLPEDKTRIYREQLFAGGLQMHVQPVVDMTTGEVGHVEALARLSMPDGRIVPPSEFLASLGDAELEQVFRVGLDQTLGALRQWERQGRAIDASINLPPSTLLDPGNAKRVEEALRRHGIAPGRLTLDLLEPRAFDSDAQRRAIEALRDIGVRLAMDDLGSGYSSIHRLSTLTFDTVRIDQHLLQQMYSSPLQTVTLVGTLIMLGSDLGKLVVVEGVEDASMFEVVKVFGAGFSQGYAIAAPMPLAHLPAWLDTFSLPLDVDDERIVTYPGALAYHWRFVHLNGNRHPSAAAACPLSRFLAEQGAAGTEVERWHEMLHGGESTQTAEASRKLSQWLAAQITSGRRAARPEPAVASRFSS